MLNDSKGTALVIMSVIETVKKVGEVARPVQLLAVGWTKQSLV